MEEIGEAFVIGVMLLLPLVAGAGLVYMLYEKIYLKPKIRDKTRVKSERETR